MRWVEVPAYRVLEVDTDEFQRDFEEVNENGDPASSGLTVYRIIRKKDGKVFRPPLYHAGMADFGRLVYLEEI